MPVKRHSNRSKIWDEARIEKITRELARQGLYRSEASRLPKKLRHSIKALQAFPRTLAPDLKTERISASESIFRDACRERAKFLPSRHPGFLHDDPGSFILRRAPSSLREAIARDLVENGVLDEFSTKFRLTAFLISRGLRDQEIVEKIFPPSIISFQEFLSYQVKFERMVSSAKTHFFAENKFIDSKIGTTLWKRFDAAWKTLSIKQKSALEIYIMDDDPMSLEVGAKRLKISKSAFRERVDSGSKKMEKAFPDLAYLRSAEAPIRVLKKKKVAKIIPVRKDAPNRQALNEWLDKTTIEPQWPEWGGVFKNLKSHNGDSANDE